jgi:hypothetical protein
MEGLQAVKAARCFDGDAFLLGGVTVLLEGEQIVGVEPRGHEALGSAELSHSSVSASSSSAARASVRDCWA